MTAIDMLAAISGTKSLAVLDGFARNLWADWADGKLTDDQAGALAETLERRKREVRGVDTVRRARRRSAQRRKRRGGRAISRPSAKGRFTKIDASRSSGGGRWRPRGQCRRPWPACSRRASLRPCGSSPTRRGTANNAD
jgi:hypothetical protein